MNWYFDTSVLVAAAVARHPHNAPALAALEALVNGKAPRIYPRSQPDQDLFGTDTNAV